MHSASDFGDFDAGTGTGRDVPEPARHQDGHAVAHGLRLLHVVRGEHGAALTVPQGGADGSPKQPHATSDINTLPQWRRFSRLIADRQEQSWAKEPVKYFLFFKFDLKMRINEQLKKTISNIQPSFMLLFK